MAIEVIVADAGNWSSCRSRRSVRRQNLIRNRGGALLDVIEPRERAEAVPPRAGGRSMRLPVAQVLGRARESLAGPDVLRVLMGIRRAEHGGGSAETGETTATTEANRMSANSRCHRSFLVQLDHLRDHGFAGGPFVGCAGGPLP